MTTKKLLSLITVIAIMLTVCITAYAQEVISFTLQPKGGETTNGEYFTFSWATDKECRYMLQMRDDETYDWGNVDWITSPYSVEYSNFTSQFRIMAVSNVDSSEYFSDAFTITWKPAADLTEVEMEPVIFVDLPLGYSESEMETIPIKVTNTGTQTLREPNVFMGDGSDMYFEIIQNKKPKDIPAGKTDSTTWSIRPKIGLGEGYYHELFYLSAANIAEYASSSCDLWVNESDVAITFSMEANDIEFGTLEEGYGNVDDITLTVRATGTGNLTKVHIKVEDADSSFFTLKQNNAQIDNLTAGTDSGSNWYVYLNGGLKPGDYSTYILVYAAEITEPIKVKISANITAKEVSEPSEVTESLDESSGEASEDISGESSEASSEEASETNSSNSSHIKRLTPMTKKGYMWPIIAIVAAVIIIIAIIVVLVPLKNKKSKNEDNNYNGTAGGGTPFGVTFDENAGSIGENIVDVNGIEYGAGYFGNNVNDGTGYGSNADGYGTDYNYNGMPTDPNNGN